MSEQQKILEMIEKGLITAAEGMELLDALNVTNESVPEQTTAITGAANRKYKFLKVRVTSDNKAVNVSVNVPLRLLTTIGEIADKMTAIIPEDARRNMESKGVNISNIDFTKIIEEIINGTLDDPSIVDVEAWDEASKSMIMVKVYVD
ncbi:SHOCT-like domain-containing protein [Lacrimispora sp. 38-1]|uniref:SHOCT-like domain-containing protein n=1 Tax=Lacrimispora sp. 38-1 TaxID=3125778 RepID=UPI003CF209BF